MSEATFRAECSRGTASELSVATGLTVFDTDEAGPHGEPIIEFSGHTEQIATLRMLVSGNYLNLEIWDAR